MGNKISCLREFGRFRLDAEKSVLWFEDEPVNLSLKEIEVLSVLTEKHGEVVTKDEIFGKVWRDSFVEESNLSRHIYLLRKMFAEFGERADLIQTVPRRGYRFTGEIRENDHDELIIERHSISETLIQELEDSVEPNRTALNYSPNLPWQRLSAAFLIIVFSILVGFYFYAQTPSRTEGIKSIAVLPLKNLNAEGSNQTFSLGLTDALISRLGKLNRFAVRPFSAVEKYEKSGKDALSFGQELRTDAVLEGTIQTLDNRLRVNLRLIDVGNGQQIWTDNLDETEADLLKLQDSISNKVARFLLQKLQPEEEAILAQKPTTNQDAYRLYLMGREHWMRREWTTDCLTFYRKALDLDPNFALPYLGIADLYAFTYETKIAEDALARAVELDPNLAEAHATRGFLQMFHHWDWPGAENSLRRAVEISSNSSKAHHWFGVYLSIRGRLDEAEREMERALELDPTALPIMADLAELHYFKRDYARAENELNKVLAIDPSFLNGRMYLIKVRYKRGGSYFLENAGFDIFLQHKRKAEGLPVEFETAELERLLASRDEATLRNIYFNSTLKSLKGKSEGYLALSKHYSVTGEKKKSLEMLEKARQFRVFTIPFAAVDPLWDPVRQEPQFQEILRKMNLR